MITIERLTKEEGPEYESLNQSLPESLLYTSLSYRDFLQKVLPDAEPVYLIAKRKEQFVGALPTYVFCGEMGNVINSLPFYGSNGCVVADSKNLHYERILQTLLNGLDDLARERKALTTTIITNPLVPKSTTFLDALSDRSLKDERIGQIKQLPICGTDRQSIEKHLMSTFHSKTRNMVRKGQKSAFTYYKGSERKDFKSLFVLHKANMQAIGGQFKQWLVFEEIWKNFTPGTDYELYIAQQDDRIVAALLVFYYNAIVEYFTPAVHIDYRSQQPLSFLIYEAMINACQRGCRFWNWGGTWVSQRGVYRFKSRWGTRDMPYYYYIREYQQHGSFRQCSPEQLLSAYPNFYTIPFSVLEQRN